MALGGLAIDDIKVAVAERLKPGIAVRLREVQPLSIIARCWVFLFTQHHRESLSAHVANLAEFGAALFVSKRHCGSSYAAQTMRSIARAINSHIKCIARAQLEGIDEFYPFINSTHLLEQLFGVFRTLVGPQRNIDLLQFEERISTVFALQSIFEEHPDWRKGCQRRLAQSFGHWNALSWTGDVDPG